MVEASDNSKKNLKITRFIRMVYCGFTMEASDCFPCSLPHVNNSQGLKAVSVCFFLKDINTRLFIHNTVLVSVFRIAIQKDLHIQNCFIHSLIILYFFSMPFETEDEP